MCNLDSKTKEKYENISYLRFWNQILICLSVKHKAWAISILKQKKNIEDMKGEFLLMKFLLSVSYEQSLCIKQLHDWIFLMNPFACKSVSVSLSLYVSLSLFVSLCLSLPLNFSLCQMTFINDFH